MNRGEVGNDRHHWEQAYRDKPPERQGWYAPELTTSVSWIRSLRLPPSAPVIDVGGGASTLVDSLLGDGYESVTVLDIASAALHAAKARLGASATDASWVNGDIRTVALRAAYYAVWHDRAAFHFLTDESDQDIYRRQLLHALAPGGHVIIGAFAPAAPPKCSGLPVRRYSVQALQSAFGKRFKLVRHQTQLHVTPGGIEQMYLYCHFQLAEL